MGFLNLSLGQFLTLFIAAGGLTYALYLLDRSRRRVVVPTLRFWKAAEQPAAVARRKTVSQPWSLLLHLLGILLLLLAIAQLRFGILTSKPRDHIVLLDTSAWMNAKAAPAAGQPKQPLIDAARKQAALFIRSLPGVDRVMLVRTDALTTPATPFLSDRAALLRAIAASKPGSTALDLDQALAFAQRTLQLSGNRVGEIVYAGAARVDQIPTGPLPSNLRVLRVADPVTNRGIRKAGVRRAPDDPGVWDVYVSVHNFTAQPATGVVSIGFGGAPAGAQQVVMPPNADKDVAFRLRTRAAGLLDVRLSPSDDFPDDNRAVLEVPAASGVNVTVYSDAPDSLRPFFGANSRIASVFHSTAQYQPGTKGLVVLDRFRPKELPQGDTLWIDPPPAGSPIPVKARIQNAGAIHWSTGDPIAAGLQSGDARPGAATVFIAAPQDHQVAFIDEGPVVVARQSGDQRMAVIGFQPLSPGMRYEVASPLLIGNLLRWMSPASFRNIDISVSSVGTVNADLDSNIDPGSVRVIREDGQPLPFSLSGRSLHFFSGTRGIVRVLAGSRETVYSLSLPGMWTKQWDPPASVQRTPSSARDNSASSRDLWQLLALLGAACFVAEWLMFGRMSRELRAHPSRG